MKNQKGITLVALIITIIVMVILAGVIIVSAVADGGIIDRAQGAMREQEKAEVEDLIIASYVYKEVATTGNQYAYLDLGKTGIAIYENLDANGFEVTNRVQAEDENGNKLVDEGDNPIWTPEIKDDGNGNQIIDVEVQGKHDDYEIEVDENGIREPVPPPPPEPVKNYFTFSELSTLDNYGSLLGEMPGNAYMYFAEDFYNATGTEEFRSKYGIKIDISDGFNILEKYDGTLESENDIFMYTSELKETEEATGFIFAESVVPDVEGVPESFRDRIGEDIVIIAFLDDFDMSQYLENKFYFGMSPETEEKIKELNKEIYGYYEIEVDSSKVGYWISKEKAKMLRGEKNNEKEKEFNILSISPATEVEKRELTAPFIVAAYIQDSYTAQLEDGTTKEFQNAVFSIPAKNNEIGDALFGYIKKENGIYKLIVLNTEHDTSNENVGEDEKIITYKKIEEVNLAFGKKEILPTNFANISDVYEILDDEVMSRRYITISFNKEDNIYYEGIAIKDLNLDLLLSKANYIIKNDFKAKMSNGEENDYTGKDVVFAYSYQCETAIQSSTSSKYYQKYVPVGYFKDDKTFVKFYITLPYNPTFDDNNYPTIYEELREDYTATLREE